MHHVLLRNGDLVPSFRFPAFFEEEDVEPFTTRSGLSLSEDDKHVYIEAAIAGVDPEDLEVTFGKGTLWIKGEAKEEEKKEEKKRKYYRKAERSYSYRVVIPIDVDSSVEPTAVVKKGIVTVTLAKSPKTQPKKIAVKVGK